MAVQYSPDGRQLAVGGFDGCVTVYDATSCAPQSDFQIARAVKTDAAKLPVTSLRYHPHLPQLFVTGSDGTIERRDLRTMDCVSRLKEEGNEIYCCDIRKDAGLFATAGLDGVVRVYDESTNTVVHGYAVTDVSVNLHPVRLYSVVFAPDDPNLLYSCGWTNSIHCFDLREKLTVNRKHDFFGHYMIGDALDIRGNTMVAASNRLQNRLHIIDLATRHSTEMLWPTSLNFAPVCAKFSKDSAGELIAIGGGGPSGLQDVGMIVDRKTNKVVVESTYEGCITSVATSTRDSGVAFGDATGSVHMLERVQRK